MVLYPYEVQCYFILYYGISWSVLCMKPDDSFILLIYQIAVIFGCIHLGYLLAQCGV